MTEEIGAGRFRRCCGDTAFKVANRAMELMGDHGYLATNRAEKAMRDARLNQIYEGTNQINYLAFIESFWGSETG
jgi:alkylation response protein AidB-like acyl-CoA dehydrogenase